MKRRLLGLPARGWLLFAALVATLGALGPLLDRCSP